MDEGSRQPASISDLRHNPVKVFRRVPNILFTDGACLIDNDACEDSIRPFVIGRRNWLFSNTVAGAQTSANLYSLLQTCGRCSAPCLARKRQRPTRRFGLGASHCLAAEQRSAKTLPPF